MSWSIHCDRCGVTHSMTPADGDLPRYWREIDGNHYCGGGTWGNGCARKKAREKLIANITEKNRHPEITWGAPVGNEEW